MENARARQLLESKREELTHLMKVATDQGSLDEAQGDSAGEVAAYDQHNADIATDTLERELDLSVRDGAEARLQDVDRALDRIEKGTYGVCPVCNERIPDERLEIVPEAEFCVEHQPSAPAE